MTILYLKTDIHFGPLKLGGSISHMLGMLQGLSAHRITLIVASSVDHEQIDALCFKKYLLAMPGIFKYLRWKINCILSSFFFLPLVLYLIYKYQPDYIYQRYSPFNFTGIFAQYLTNVPLILEYNGSEVWADKAWHTISHKQKFMMSFMGWCEKKILLLSTYRTVVSSVLKDELTQRYGLCDNIRVVTNGVNTDVFSPWVNARPLTNAQGSFLIGFASSFRVWHGVDVIEYLISEFAHHKAPFHMLLLGTGPLYNQLRANTAHAHEYVTFAGSIAHRDMPSYLAACDAFICPTQPNQDGTTFFGCPTKLFEYASAAKPIISSDMQQTNSLLPPLLKLDKCLSTQRIDHQAGICVPPTDKPGFLSACYFVQALSKEQRGIMGNNARKHMIQHYEWSTIASSLINSLKG